MWIKALTRSLLAVIGVVAIVAAVRLMYDFIMILAFLIIGIAQGEKHLLEEIPATMVASFIIPMALIAVGLVLILRPPRCLWDLAVEDNGQGQIQIIPAKTVFATVSTFLGVVLLFWTTPYVVNLVHNIVIKLHDPFGDQRIFPSPWPQAITLAVQLAAGIYFLLGAPHFVRWQLRKVGANRDPLG